MLRMERRHMSMDNPIDPAAAGDEHPTTHTELVLEREKIELERERLALERERLAAERLCSALDLVPRMVRLAGADLSAVLPEALGKSE